MFKKIRYLECCNEFLDRCLCGFMKPMPCARCPVPGACSVVLWVVGSAGGWSIRRGCSCYDGTCPRRVGVAFYNTSVENVACS